MKKFKIYYTVVLAVLFFASCSKDQYKSAIDDDTAPEPVTDVTVEPIPGGAKITYKLPVSESFRYVRAEYNIRGDLKREAKSSLYSNYVVLDGFPETEEYEVKLYSVSNGENS